MFSAINIGLIQLVVKSNWHILYTVTVQRDDLGVNITLLLMCRCEESVHAPSCIICVRLTLRMMGNLTFIVVCYADRKIDMHDIVRSIQHRDSSRTECKQSLSRRIVVLQQQEHNTVMTSWMRVFTYVTMLRRFHLSTLRVRHG